MQACSTKWRHGFVISSTTSLRVLSCPRPGYSTRTLLKSKSTAASPKSKKKVLKPMSFTGPQPEATTTPKPIPTANINAISGRRPKTADGEDVRGWDRRNPNRPPLTITPVYPLPDNDLSSTRPAQLDLPAQASNDSNGHVTVTPRLKHLYRMGKAYLAFYKTGLKNVWANYKEARKIHARFGDPVLNALYNRERKSVDSNVVGVTMEPNETVSRKQLQLCLRSNHDIWKLVPFSLLLLVFGEWLPLLMPFIGSSVVPKTCILPTQIHDEFQRFEQRNNRKLMRACDLYKKESALVRQDKHVPKWYYFNAQGRLELLIRSHYIASYRLRYSPIATPPPIVYGAFHRFVDRRLCRWADEYLADIVSVRREGGYARLDPIEVYYCAVNSQDEKIRRKLSEMRRTHAGGLDAHGETVKNTLVPLLEAHADAVLSENHAKIAPKMRWYTIFLSSMDLPDPR